MIKPEEKRSLIFRNPNLAHGFTQIPNVILKDATLSANAVRLYILLLSYAWQEKECFPGQDRLAADMGCNRTTINRNLSELKKRKLITWERRGLCKCNIYYIERLEGGYLPKLFIDKGSRG